MIQKILLLFCAIFGVNLNPTGNIVKCKLEDFACVTKNANYIYQQAIAGVPELNIENSDPMYQPYVEADLAVIKYKLYNSTLTGFSKCVIVNWQIDVKKPMFRLEMDCPRFVMTGIYEISGNLLSLPIQGKGDYSLDCTDYHLRLDSDIEVSQGQDGKKYMSIKSYKVDGDLRGGMVADLENLFNGENKELAETVLSFIKSNQKAVAKLLQGPTFNANVKKLAKNFNKILKKRFPISDIIEL